MLLLRIRYRFVFLLRIRCRLVCCTKLLAQLAKTRPKAILARIRGVMRFDNIFPASLLHGWHLWRQYYGKHLWKPQDQLQGHPGTIPCYIPVFLLGYLGLKSLLQIGTDIQYHQCIRHRQRILPTTHFELIEQRLGTTIGMDFQLFPRYTTGADLQPQPQLQASSPEPCM